MRFFRTKLEASVEKDAALTAKTQRLPAGTTYRTPCSLPSFFEAHGLCDDPHTEHISETHLAKMQAMLVPAGDIASALMRGS